MPFAAANGRAVHYRDRMATTDLVASLLDRAAADQDSPVALPESTYRLQFHKGFTFRAAAAAISYLADLGVTHLYASPYLKARAGSTHGYDITDHRVLNPEIGGERDYAAMTDALHQHGLGQVLDMVPNHMGVAGNDNVWWNDVLENGLASPYAVFFDIDWYSSLKAELREKVLLPVLGETYGTVLHAGQLRLDYAHGAFSIYYFTHRFPVSPDSYARVLEHRLPDLEKTLGADSTPFVDYQSIVTAIRHLPPRGEPDPARRAERLREKEVIKRRLAALAETCAEVRDFLDENVKVFNGTPGDSHSFDRLDELLNDQAYRLSFWRVAADEINYRRFFDVNELAALNMERPEVFAQTHQLVFQLVREGKIDGLRIDHPDGLYDPKQYLDRLQEQYTLERARAAFDALPANDATWDDLDAPLLEEIRRRRQDGDVGLQRPMYVVVEKILGRAEPLPDDWPVHGTTGYEFLNSLNGLFVDASHVASTTKTYHAFTGMDPAFRPYVYDKKRLIMQVSLSSELQMLSHQLNRLSEKDRAARDFTFNSLRHALREVIACFPVYRSYVRDGEVQTRDRLYVQTAVLQARRRNPAVSAALFDYVRDMLLLKSADTTAEEFQAEQRRFVSKFQQVTSPVMAKGVEDTAFYVYNRLVSLNEVGGEPDQFGVAPAAFHRANLERQSHWPRSMTTTATHDTKRGEDVRARLNVLSELPGEWRKAIVRWGRMNKRHLVVMEDVVAPDRNEEYLIYQTLVGAWPSAGMTSESLPEFRRRIQEYVQKALHEAKIHTSWINPNPAYDDAVRTFVERILDEKYGMRFQGDLATFVQRVAPFGYLNSLSQVVLKIAAPGMPDTYQGTDLWDFSLVDPDNRRPVDYAARHAMLKDLQARSSGDGPHDDLARELTRHVEAGRIKLYVTHRALLCRRQHPGLFSEGEYHAADAQGSRADNVIAFVRRAGGISALVAAPRLVTRLGSAMPLGEDAWQDTLVPVSGPARRFRDAFSGAILTADERDGQAWFRAADLFARFPVALLVSQD